MIDSDNRFTLNVVGAGRLGQVLAHLLVQQRVVTIGGLLNSTEASTKVARQHIGEGQVCTHMTQLPQVDITLLGVPDRALQDVVQQILSHRHHLLKPNSIVFHCSGSISSEVLHPLQEQGIYVASMHPIYSFTHDFKTSCSHFSKACCTLEGDPQACVTLSSMMSALGAQIIPMQIASSDHKALYHAALVFASNYMVVLLDAAQRILAGLEFSHTDIKSMLSPLSQQVIAQACQTLGGKTLTGPLARGDLEVVEQHQACLGRYNVELRLLYEQLAQHTLTLLNRHEDREN